MARMGAQNKTASKSAGRYGSKWASNLRRLLPRLKVISYAEKDDPQPQVVVALGFLITNCEPLMSSL
jgi:hypothetical protein